MIEMGKKYQTRDGRAVRILATDVNHPPFPVVGTIIYANESEGNFQWAANGSYYPEENHISDLDLIPVPTKHEGWVVIGWLEDSHYQTNKVVWNSHAEAVAHADHLSGIGQYIAHVTWES